MERIADFVSYVLERKSKQTARAYTRGAERFERFCKELDVTGGLEGQPPGFMDNYVSWMIRQDLSPATVRLMLAGSNAYLDWRKRQGEKIPTFLSPDLPKIIQKKPYSLTTEELVWYWRTCATHPDPVRTMLILLPLCGLRSEEIVTIRLEKDVEIRPPDPLSDDPTVWVVFHVTGKGSKLRSVPLLPQGNSILHQYMNGWRVHNKKDNPFLFPGHSKGSHYQTRSLRRHMKDIREEMDLEEPLTPHVLRKTYLTFLDRAGITAFAIAALAGHSSPRVTHENYINHGVDSLIQKLTD
jgi:site-specific recombinase XerD